jgi:hypothetical protein
MYSSIRMFKVCLLTIGLITGTVGAKASTPGGSPERECAMVLHKALTLMNEVYDGNQGLVRWSVQNTMGAEDSGVLIEELRWDGTKTRYKNEHMFLYRDGKEEILIMHDQQLILIRKQIDFTKQKLLPAASQADTLLNNASSVSCAEMNGKKTTSLLYDEMVQGQYNPIKSMRIWCTEGGELEVMELLFRKDKTMLTQRVEMLEMNKNVPIESFKYKARELIFDSNGKLLPQYRLYDVNDWKH